MKHVKKILALLIAAMMVLTLGAAALAENGGSSAAGNSVTVTNTVAGETYAIYRMMDLEVNDPSNPTAFKYTVAERWTDFFTTGFGKDYVTIDSTDGHVTWVAEKKNEPDMILLAQNAASYAKDNDNNIDPAAGPTEATGEEVTFGSLPNGYYLITSTLGTKAMIDSTPTNPAQTIAEKNPEDTITKQVQEDATSAWGLSNDAQIGNTVSFKSTATLQPYTRNVVIHDAMDAGLTYKRDVAIANLGADKYTVLETPAAGDTFTIRILDTYIATLTEPMTLEITYTAVLNAAAVGGTPLAIVEQKNRTSISYGDKQSVTSETTTTTHAFSVHKHAENSTDNLAGAVFKLKKAGDVVKLTKIDDTNYRVDPEGTAESVTTVADGDIVIWGVDADNDYSLEETQAPTGYNKLAAEVPVAVTADNSTRIDIENKTGTELPSTGGIGTTIFYVGGSVLVVVAIILLVTKRRTKGD